MKAAASHYLNDIVSLTVLALMAVALIAGQADRSAYASLEIAAPAPIRVEINVGHGLSELAQIDVSEGSLEALRKIIEAGLATGQ